MADISKITLPNGSSYNFKDATARNGKQNIRNGTANGAVNWNTLTTAGTYKIQHTTMSADYNAPVGEYSFGILVVFDSESGGENRIIQIYFPHYGTSSKNYMCIRMRNNDYWGDWIYLSKNADTVDGKHASDFAAASHAHVISDVDGLQTALDGKANSDDIPDLSLYALKSKYGDTTINVGRKANTTVGSRSTAEGFNTTASEDSSHAEGINSTASGMASHAEGGNTTASKDSSHAEGKQTTASGSSSHAEGGSTTASGNYSHAEGYRTTASGPQSHAEGSNINSSGNANGNRSIRVYTNPNLEDSTYTDYTIKGSTAYGTNSHAEGTQTFAYGFSSHSEGNITTASGESSHVEGHYGTASGQYSHAEGCLPTASGKASHSEGESTTASGPQSHAEGYKSTASSEYAHAEGQQTTASGSSSHAEGNQSKASGNMSHAEGFSTTASGICSHAEGEYTTASNRSSHASGKFNASMTDGGLTSNTTGTAFVIGNGTSKSALSNAFSVMFDGTVKAAKTITASTTADYAEFFEWLDGNHDSEDRVGYFVTMDGDKIRIANPDDDYILGVVSGEPFVLGNGDCDVWNGMFLRDEFRRTIYEPAPKIEEILDDDGNPTGEFEEIEGAFEGIRPKLNPEYDHTKTYISRFDRPEWAPIGMLGVLAVRHDGTAKVNGYVTVADGGIATACDKSTENSYRVIKSNSDSVVEIIFR